MKSILQEASSIAKAIDTAWRSAGMPEEFTVKIFEIEKKNFFGFVSSPAVISLMYDPKKFTKGQKDGKMHDFGTISRQEDQASYKHKRSFQQRDQRERDPRAFHKESNEDESNKGLVGDIYLWQAEMLMDVTRWLKEILEMLHMQTKFDYEVDNGFLKIRFNRPLVNETEYEQMFFASLSHSLMQFLKKKFKNQLKGLRVIITSVR